jgi:hypothetical protein
MNIQFDLAPKPALSTNLSYGDPHSKSPHDQRPISNVSRIDSWRTYAIILERKQFLLITHEPLETGISVPKWSILVRLPPLPIIPQIPSTNNPTVPISIAIIFVSFLLAFSTFTRAGLSFIFDLAWWNFITSTRIYTLWMEFKLDSADLNKRRLKTIRLWKESARDERLKRREEKAAKKVADAAAAMASGVEGDRGVNGGAGGIRMRRRGDSAV